MKFLVQGDLPPHLSAVALGGRELSELGAIPWQDLVAPASPRGVLPGRTRVPGHVGGYEHPLHVLPKSREHESRKSGDHGPHGGLSQYQVLLCLRSSPQATRAPCVSVGPPGGPGSRPCTFPWEPVPPKSAVEAYPISRASTLATVVLNYRFPICPCSPENRQDPPPRLHFQPHTHRGWSGRWKQIPFPGACGHSSRPQGPGWTRGFRNRLLREKKV